MRKTLLALAVLAVLAISATTATAQNEISFGGSAANTLVFTATGGGNFTLSLSSSPLVGAKQTATGALGWGAISGYYEITGGSLTGTLTQTFPGGTGGEWNITGGTWGFDICPTPKACTASTALLIGSLTLVNLQEDGASGTFNYNATVNLTITGGKDASLIPTGIAIVQISIDLPKGTNLAALTSGTVKGNISSGEIDQVPEPGSMTLLGSGLVLLGVLVRRRFRKV